MQASEASPRRWPIALFGLWTATRALAWAVGLRFDDGALCKTFQFLDPELLRHELLRSVYHLHSQPPLYNLFLGVVLKLFPGAEAPAFHAAYLLCGATISGSMFLLQRELGVGARRAFAVTALFACSPASLLYENWLFYTYPTVALLCLGAVLARRFYGGGRAGAGLLFHGVLGTVLLTRSAFHPLWLVVLAGAALRSPGLPRRTVLLTAALPLLLCLGWYAKNSIEFGFFGSSSWLGMSVAKMSVSRLPKETRTQLIRERVLTRASSYRPFLPPERYPFIRRGAGSTTGVAALDQLQKSCGQPNFNHIGLVGLSQMYRHDAIASILRDPRPYLHSVSVALQIYFGAPNDHFQLQTNRKHLHVYERAYNLLVYGQLAYRVDPVAPQRAVPAWTWDNLPRIGWLTAALYAYVLAAGLRRVAGPLLRGQADAETLTLFYLWWTVAYVSVLCNLVESGENNRFRFMAEPLALILLAALTRRFGRSEVS